MLARAVDVPTLETLAAAPLLRQQLPDLRVRVINVVDLMRLQPELEHPHGVNRSGLSRLNVTELPEMSDESNPIGSQRPLVRSLRNSQTGKAIQLNQEFDAGALPTMPRTSISEYSLATPTL